MENINTGIRESQEISMEGKSGEYSQVQSLLKDVLTPKKVFFTSGKGYHEDELVSFELALRDAGIEKYNLVKVSSIFPPGCEVIGVVDGVSMLNPGQIVFCVMSRKTSSEQGKKIFASVGAAIPKDTALHGYISEYNGYQEDEESGKFCSAEEIGKYSEEMAGQMLETAYGIEPDETFSLTEVAEVRKCTTVVSAAVFVI